MDRSQTASRGKAIFKERCCRISYGVRCREEYDPNEPKHVGHVVSRDPRDGKTYVENQIDWFVKQVRSYASIVLLTY